jgi:PTS system fructose-specific IIC component
MPTRPAFRRPGRRSLRRAPAKAGVPLEVELHSGQGVANPVIPAEGDRVLFVGPDYAAEPRAHCRLSIEDVLANPGAGRTGLIGSSAAVTGAKSLPSRPAPPDRAYFHGGRRVARKARDSWATRSMSKRRGRSARAIPDRTGHCRSRSGPDRGGPRSRPRPLCRKARFRFNTKPAITGGAALIERAFAEASVQAGDSTGAEAPAGARRALQAPDDRRLVHAALRGAGAF